MKNNLQFQINPFFHWFWRSRQRWKDYPTIVEVSGGGPFFQYQYWEDFCPVKHKNVKIQGHN
jgi:hypothetical protein